MKKIFLILIISVLIFGVYFWMKEPEKTSDLYSGQKMESLESIIFENTEFDVFNYGHFYFKYPIDWQKVDIDSVLLWPEMITQKQRILIYLTNQDGVKIIATKREVDSEYYQRPYPLVFREIFAQDNELLKESGGISDIFIVNEKFFEQGVLIESQITAFETTNTALQKSLIVNEDNSRIIYSVTVSAQENIFEDYRELANFIADSLRYY